MLRPAGSAKFWKLPDQPRSRSLPVSRIANRSEPGCPLTPSVQNGGSTGGGRQAAGTKPRSSLAVERARAELRTQDLRGDALPARDGEADIHPRRAGVAGGAEQGGEGLATELPTELPRAELQAGQGVARAAGVEPPDADAHPERASAIADAVQVAGRIAVGAFVELFAGEQLPLDLEPGGAARYRALDRQRQGRGSARGPS